MKHTEGKLEVIKVECEDFKQLVIASDKKKEVLLHIYLPQYKITEELEANAERIVKTWNCHDELVEALKELYRFARCSETNTGYENALNQAEAALKATE